MVAGWILQEVKLYLPILWLQVIGAVFWLLIHGGWCRLKKVLDLQVRQRVLDGRGSECF